ncbi:MAG: LLM class flavin-dependent oxidoreductase [SAR202 cluster bacterium]|nr:LLM class flavin-dependent oxidoreductase [SAR202 cluster bacterium]
MQIDLRIASSKPVAEIVDFARRCEDAGFSGLGFVDSHTFLRDVYVVMAQVLQNTERIRVRPAVTCPGPRHTSVIASVAKTVQELGPNRFELWLGRGGSANFLIGLSRLRLAETRKAIVEIKAFMAGEWDVYQPAESVQKYGSETGTSKRAERVRLFHGGGEPLPVYLTASGPLNARLAGELCDGALIHPTMVNEEQIGELRQWVGEGAALAGRKASDVHEILQLEGLVRDTLKDAVRAWSPRLVTPLAKPSGQDWLEQLGIDYDLSPIKAKLQGAAAKFLTFYPDNNHMEDWQEAEKVAEVVPYELQEALVEKTAVVGDPDLVTQRMKELEALGVHHIYLYPAESFTLPEHELRAFKEVIGPAFNLS